ncbi:cell surface protein MPL17 [Leptospira sp. SA-E8]|uniref:cell surface protein MPL17 n=1 Tax=Leptospira sp. SA-E8 TaxID=3422259 RepID=UPI003EBEE318
MKRFLFLAIISLFLISGLSAEEENPIKFKIEKSSPSVYLLKVAYPENFGIQKEAPHRILLNAGSGLKVVSADLKLKGKTSTRKKEYFESVEPMQLKLEGKGELEIHAKIFYCDYNRNICIPGKILQKEIIQ